MQCPGVCYGVPSPPPEAGAYDPFDPLEQTYWYTGVWEYSGGAWQLVHETGPALMYEDPAYGAYDASPLVNYDAPPYYWSGLWRWTGYDWEQRAESRNY